MLNLCLIAQVTEPFPFLNTAIRSDARGSMDCSLAQQWDCRVCGGDEETADVNFSVGVASCG